jgi:hypothetical protein
VGLIGGGGAALWADRTQRDGGYVTTDPHHYTTASYALSSTSIELPGGGPGWLSPGGGLGMVRIRATGSDPARPLFAGIAPTADVERYLAPVGYDTVTDDVVNGRHRATYQRHSGGAPEVPPGELTFWTASSSGTGMRTLTWKAAAGSWTIVAMAADGRPGVSVTVDVGATVPPLPWAATGLLAGGALLLAVAVLLVVTAARRASPDAKANGDASGSAGRRD